YLYNYDKGLLKTHDSETSTRRSRPPKTISVQLVKFLYLALIIGLDPTIFKEGGPICNTSSSTEWTVFNFRMKFKMRMFNEIEDVHLLREKLELCNKDGAHATVVHLGIEAAILNDRRVQLRALSQKFNISYGAVYDTVHENLKFRIVT
ncbi:hypothetical protein L9F63_019256, partial [Diploptera punctata]